MQVNELDKPADLAVWTKGAAPAPTPAKPFASLREAAAAGLEALKAGANAWIVTEGGTVLSPAWIRGHGPALVGAR